MSLPIIADVSVNRMPASCIPSPESPAKRTVADETLTTSLLGATIECSLIPAAILPAHGRNVPMGPAV
jgi:hypothetical protein